jgi:hypothetical protein
MQNLHLQIPRRGNPRSSLTLRNQILRQSFPSRVTLIPSDPDTAKQLCKAEQGADKKILNHQEAGMELFYPYHDSSLSQQATNESDSELSSLTDEPPKKKKKVDRLSLVLMHLTFIQTSSKSAAKKKATTKSKSSGSTSNLSKDEAEVKRLKVKFKLSILVHI